MSIRDINNMIDNYGDLFIVVFDIGADGIITDQTELPGFTNELTAVEYAKGLAGMSKVLDYTYLVKVSKISRQPGGDDLITEVIFKETKGLN